MQEKRTQVNHAPRNSNQMCCLSMVDRKLRDGTGLVDGKYMMLRIWPPISMLILPPAMRRAFLASRRFSGDTTWRIKREAASAPLSPTHFIEGYCPSRSRISLSATISSSPSALVCLRHDCTMSQIRSPRLLASAILRNNHRATRGAIQFLFPSQRQPESARNGCAGAHSIRLFLWTGLTGMSQAPAIAARFRHQPEESPALYCAGLTIPNQTLNLKNMISPSCTTYSRPSWRIFPAARTAASEPYWMRSS